MVRKRSHRSQVASHMLKHPNVKHETCDMQLVASNLQPATCNLQRVTCSAILFLLIGLTGCGQQGQTASGSATTTTTLPPPLQAQLVLGQIAFTRDDQNQVDAVGFSGVSRVAVDSGHDRLYVVDSENSRVFGFNNLSALALNAPTADIVIGQPDFTSNLCNRGGTTAGPDSLCHPIGIAVDSSGDLYVADTGNNRVLFYPFPISTADMAATIVFGQPDLFTNTENTGGLSAMSLHAPVDATVDNSGNLYVADTGNNRVLVYTQPMTDSTADFVIGQANMSSSACNQTVQPSANPSAVSLCGPQGLAVDSSDNLYVADTLNNRVLEYQTPLLTDAAADVAFGQTNFTIFDSNLCITRDSGLCLPMAVTLDTAGDLYLADNGNNRALEYNQPIAVSGKSTGSNTSTTLNDNTQAFTTNQYVNFTVKITFGTGAGQVRTITSNANTQITVSPSWSVSPDNTSFYQIIGDIVADQVFGQGDLFAPVSPNTANTCNNTAAVVGGLSAKSLCSPGGVALDGTGNLYVADTSNYRVLKYNAPFSSPGDTTADLVLGQPSFTAVGINFVDAVGLNSPSGVAVDANNNLFYIADTENNRVLGYTNLSALLSGAPADIVIGQVDMNSSLCDKGQKNVQDLPLPDATTLCHPNGLAVDSLGNLYVADTENNRVLEYNTPFTSDKTADLVFGQLTSSSFTTRACAASNTRMCLPMGVAVDSANNLYVADTGNNRVLEFNTPITTDITSDRVFGQPDFVSNGSNTGGLSAASVSFPEGVALDSADNLYVVDTGNSRVLEFNTPITTDTTADRVFGQPNFISYGNGLLSATSLFFPSGIALDSAGNLYVADTSNNRILEYDTPLAAVVSSTSTGSNTSTTLNDTNQSFISDQFVDFLIEITSGTGVGQIRTIIGNTINRFTVSPSWTFIPDNTSGYKITRPATADGVFGQPDFASSSCNNPVAAIGGLSDKSLCFPEGITLDAGGNLYVADTENNRILKFP
jgi:sugar lactone lactonase YvrE